MIEIMTNADRAARADDFDTMFRARAAIFRDRLGWAVDVRDGWEVDRYDRDEDPVYLVATDAAGRLTGSLRLLPTTGETMLRNEFADFFDEPVDVTSPSIWECTRFCVHPRDGADLREDQRISSELLIGLWRLCQTSGVEQILGLYDQAMTRIYDRIGWSPVPLAHSRPEIGKLVVGIWDVSAEALEAMIRRDSAYGRNLGPRGIPVPALGMKGRKLGLNAGLTAAPITDRGLVRRDQRTCRR